MAGEDQITTPEDTQPDEAARRRRAAVLPGLVLLAALLVVAWLIWTYAQRPGSETTGVVVSPGAATVVVPDVVGLGEDDAVRILSDAGFSVDVGTSFDVLAPLGTVAEQEPAGGTSTAKGSVVSIAVVVDSEERDAFESEAAEDSGAGATGPFEPAPVVYVSVPRLVGLSEKSAINKLKAAGLDPRPMYQPRYDRVGKVYEQDPAPGTRVERGRKVFVLIGSMD
jgi:serine/threonine-protein kinase